MDCVCTNLNLITDMTLTLTQWSLCQKLGGNYSLGGYNCRTSDTAQRQDIAGLAFDFSFF